MESWILWTIVALLLFITELMTTGFAVICLSIGAGAAAIAAAYGVSLNMQLLTFAIISVLAIACIRPVLKRTFFKGGEKVITNASAIIGKHGVVCSDVDGDDDTGRVIIDGIDWRAKSEGEKIPKGTRVVVTKIESVVLTIKKL